MSDSRKKNWGRDKMLGRGEGRKIMAAEGGRGQISNIPLERFWAARVPADCAFCMSNKSTRKGSDGRALLAWPCTLGGKRVA